MISRWSVSPLLGHENAGAWLRALALLACIAVPASGADLREEIVAPFLKSVKGRLAARGSEDSYRSAIRAVLADIDGSASARTASLPERRQIEREARDALVAGLAEEMGQADGRARAESIVEAAAKERRQGRIDGLERGIICWCPEESWTRTLSGCAQGCANEQKALLRAWMDEGSTDAEILDRMVSHTKGGPKVRAMPEAAGANWVGYLGPVFLTAAGIALVALGLRRATRKRTAGPAAERAARTAERDSSDDEVGEQIERQLREMES